jgi:glyoxylase-like metal-dependent hydrolase (beta-lactamase superfamily II)
VFGDSVQPIVEAGLATHIEPDAKISPEVSVIPSQGHTPGAVSVLIHSKAESAVITGDLMHNPCQIGHPDWSTLRQRSRRRRSHATAFPERFADTPTIVLGTHFGTPTGRQVRRDGSSYRLVPLR